MKTVVYVYLDAIRLPFWLSDRLKDSLLEKLREVGSARIDESVLGFSFEADDLWELRTLAGDIKTVLESFGLHYYVPDKDKVLRRVGGDA